MVRRLGLLMVLGAVSCSSGAGSGSTGDPVAAADFCADLGGCHKQGGEAICASGICYDGRDVFDDCVAVATRFRPELMPAIDGCLATCGNDLESCLLTIEDENDDRAIDAAFAQACTDAFACGPDPAAEGFPEFCSVTGVWTEAALQSAMACLSGDCNHRGRCLADALYCHSSAPQNDYCL